MRAVQITRFGGPEVLDVVDLPDPVPGEAEQLYEVSAAGINCADTHHRLSRRPSEPAVHRHVSPGRRSRTGVARPQQTASLAARHAGRVVGG
jgi:NADPH:quinone reductase-like Zn-dependent oxidoreductase